MQSLLGKYSLPSLHPWGKYTHRLDWSVAMWFASANGMLENMTSAEAGVAGLCPWTSAITRRKSSPGQPTGPGRLSAKWARQKEGCNPESNPGWASELSRAAPANFRVTKTLFLLVTQQKLTAHTVLLVFFFLYFKFCFPGLCPLSLRGSPAPTHYGAFWRRED